MTPYNHLEIYLTDFTKPEGLKDCKETAQELGLTREDLQKFGNPSAIITYRRAIRAKASELLKTSNPDAPNLPQCCSGCNRAIESKTFRFCPNCGTKLKQSKPQSRN